MTKGGDIIALGKALDQIRGKIQANLPYGMSLRQLQDQPKAVSRAISELYAAWFRVKR